ncbi:MAG: LuxR C-terminal-related transcriptional regulator [Solirubrobacteraceae bacterium]
MPSLKSITVVLARFDDLLAGGLHDLIAGDAHLEIVASDVQHERLPAVLRGHRPDVAVIDGSRLGELIELRELGCAHPATRLVVLAQEISAGECAQALAYGASAYLGRDTQARDLLNAIHLASRGLQVMPRALSRRSGESVEGSQLLTPREGEILPLLQRGCSNAEIALALQVGVETVRTHTRNIYRKLGVSSRREIAAPSATEPRSPTRVQPPRQHATPRPVARRRGHGPLPR